MPILDPNVLRPEFPALMRPGPDGRPSVYLDGPGGTQVPQRVADAVAGYLLSHNANRGAPFRTGRQSDAVIDDAHLAVAELLNAAGPDEIVFGQNMTSLTFALSRSLARTWRPGDEVLVTRADHDANVSPWVLAAGDAGATVNHVDIDPADCRIDLADFAAKLSPRTKLLAVGMAGNAVGTIQPVAEMARAARAVGARVFVDAVHWTPHGPVDVQAAGCDFLACSAYKFFGPHVGILWGRRELLTALPAYKVRPAPDGLPGRWMTGTQNHEGIAGTRAAVEYLADVGRRFGGVAPTADRRTAVRAAMAAIREYEIGLGRRLLAGLATVPGLKVFGIADPARSAERVPTVGLRLRDIPPRRIAEDLDRRGIFAYAGNFYALPLTERLGLEATGGLLRVGFLHCNTGEEVDRLVAALADIASR